MTSLAPVSASNLPAPAGWDQAPTSAVTVPGCLLIALTTAVAYRGIEILAYVQTPMAGVQLLAMVAFGITAFTHTPAAHFSPAWLNPFGFPNGTSIAKAALLCLHTWAAPAFLGDAVLSVGLLICAYSATIFACFWYFRRNCAPPWRC